MSERSSSAERARALDFDALYEAHIGDIYAYCLRRTTDNDAHDAAAEVFTVIWRRRDDLPEGAHVRPWIYGVARNVLANRNRSARRRQRLQHRLGGLRPSVESGPEAGIDRVSDQEVVLAALARLSDRDQEMIRLIEWEGMSRDQVAAVFGVSRAAIDQRVSRAYRKLERLLSRAPTPATNTSMVGDRPGRSTT